MDLKDLKEMLQGKEAMISELTNQTGTVHVCTHHPNANSCIVA